EAARPVLAGNSVAGTELSWIASRHPDRVAGLIYLDAGYPYAFYDSERGDVVLDAMDLRRKLDALVNGPIDSRQTIRELLAEVPRFEKNLQARQKELEGLPAAMIAREPPAATRAVMAGGEEDTDLDAAPVLAVYAAAP